jgi:hypothetical protein
MPATDLNASSARYGPSLINYREKQNRRFGDSIRARVPVKP